MRSVHRFIQEIHFFFPAPSKIHQHVFKKLVILIFQLKMKKSIASELILAYLQTQEFVKYLIVPSILSNIIK